MERQFLNDMALDMGADFFGVADLDPFRQENTITPGLLDRFRCALSIGVGLSREIFENLPGGPTAHYLHHYTTANALLDQIALRLTGALQRAGHRALPIPASQVLDRENWLGALSHKSMARMAGLGWQGKSLLLVNPRVGPRLRLVTVLTDLDLAPDQPLPNGCGRCQECARACPGHAIKATPFGDGYASRDQAWDMEACTSQLARFNESLGLPSWICGLCIKACPIGKFSRKIARK